MADSPRPVLWEELTWEQITALRDGGMNLVILPVGATEQHALHLPVGVDTVSAIAIASGVSAQTGIPVLPALPYGCHVTNWAPLRCGLENVRHTYPDMRIALRSIWEISPKIHEFYDRDAANFHANCAETSVMLSLRPDLVQLDKAIDEPDRSAGCFFAYTVNKESIHGGVGSPSKANVNFGKTILETCITELSAQLKRAMTEETPLEEMLSPPL